MKQSIPVAELGARGQSMAAAVQSCVHCGFCLPACPTYQVLGEEMDSPRGRIVLMKQVLEGSLPLADALPHLDACLGCLSCETACPSGVAYRDLISPFRAHAERVRQRPVGDKLKRWFLLRLLPHPRRFALAARLGRLVKPLARLLPGSLKAMLDLLPAEFSPGGALDEKYPAQGATRARVALLAGCVQRTLAPEINRATIEVLQRNGVEVIIPPKQNCCGALAWHIGADADAARCARGNLDAFSSDVDAVLTNAAGCGSCLHEYPLILAGTGHDPVAEEFARKAMDVAEFLARLGLVPPPARELKLVVAIQDACHLLHGQQVRSAPRELLRSIPGIELREIADADLCCGSAGTYNLDQPAVAAELGQRKARAIAATGASIVVSGNIGCLIQLRAHLPANIRAMHVMELLAQAYRCD